MGSVFVRPTVLGFVIGFLVWVAIQMLFIPVYMLLRAGSNARRQSALDLVSGSLSAAGGVVLGGISSTAYPGFSPLVAGLLLAILFVSSTLRKYAQKVASLGELASVAATIIVALVVLALLA